MRSAQYQAYLKSPQWAAKRNDAMWRYDSRCHMCLGRATNVHHRSYRRLGNEKRKDLVPLCSFCHCLLHAVLTGCTGKTLPFIDRRLRRKAIRRFHPADVRASREALLSVAVRDYPKAFAAVTEVSLKFDIPFRHRRNSDLISMLAVEAEA